MRRPAIRVLFLFVMLLLTEHLSAQMLASQPAERDTMFLGIRRKTFLNYAIPVYAASVFYIQFQWWWEGNTHPFHIYEEGVWNDYSLGVDKVGHFFTSYAYFLSLYDMMRWGGHDEITSLWTGMGLTMFHAVSSEIADGFSNFGFTPADLLFNVMGLGYALFQMNDPFLQNFNFKFSYWPSPNRPRNERWRLTNDYDGHIYWLSVNVHGLLPEAAKPYWPRFLNLAVGYGGKNISHKLENVTPYRKFAIGLDYNLTIFPTGDDTWDTILKMLDHLRFPAPGVKKVEDSKTQFKPLLVY